MRIARSLLGVLVSLAACSSPAPAVRCPEPPATTVPKAEAGSPDTRVFVVRHAEKAHDGTRDPALLPEGSARATCLAQTLSDVEVTHVFATDLQRTVLTVQPLATAKGLTVETLPASDTELLAQRLRALPRGSVAVVAGHSNTIPSLTALLGAPLAALDDKGNIPDDEYDRLIALSLGDADRHTSMVQLRYCEPSP